MPDCDVQAPQGGGLVLGQGLGAVRRCWPPLDADRRVAVDPALALPPADRLARDGQFPVDGIGVHLVRPRRRQLGQHFRQRRVGVYDEGGADRGTTRARGSRSAPPLPSSVTGSIATLAPPSGTAAVNAYTSPAAAGEPAADRDDHGRGSAAVNPVFTAAVWTHR